MSALTIISADYSIRILESLGASVHASYFMRNDYTLNRYPVEPGSKGYLLGPEISARFIWSPFSDLQFNLAGGAFFPSLGNTGQDEKVRWIAELTATIAIR